MSTDLTKQPTMDPAAIKALIIGGDMKKLTEAEKVQYYRSVCDSLGLNPLTQPFNYLSLNGKEVLYATRACTEQLRKINGVSITSLEGKQVGDLYIVTCHVKDAHGRMDVSTGAVNIKGLQGDPLANAIMKSETKSKRRATLSICGLGFLDESEVDTVQHSEPPLQSKFANPTSPPPAATHKAQQEPRTNINKAEAATINGILTNAGVPWDWLLRKLEVERAGEITLKQFDNIMANSHKLRAEYDAEQEQEIVIDDSNESNYATAEAASDN